MRAFLTCWDGRRLALPELTGWRLEYGCGVPCDSFFLECLWAPGEVETLAQAVGFTAEEGGQTVFQGVVDEYACGWDGDGGKLTVSGRGLAALLLDNEALGAEYQVATLDDILRDHTAPYGIQTGELARLPAVPGFTVAAGSSEWQVLYEFCRYYGGVEPRFDRAGRLVIAPWRDEKTLLLDEGAAVGALEYRGKRYGVLSEVLVRDRTTLAVQRVADEDFARRGGRCRRVLTMPGRSSYQAMRYSGEYQLARSARERERLQLELPGDAPAWPGDLVELRLRQDVCRGLWRVRERTAGLDGGGRDTRLTLGKPE